MILRLALAAVRKFKKAQLSVEGGKMFKDEKSKVKVNRRKWSSLLKICFINAIVQKGFDERGIGGKIGGEPTDRQGKRFCTPVYNLL